MEDFDGDGNLETYTGFKDCTYHLEYTLDNLIVRFHSQTEGFIVYYVDFKLTPELKALNLIKDYMIHDDYFKQFYDHDVIFEPLDNDGWFTDSTGTDLTV